MCFSHVDIVSGIVRVRIRPISSPLDGCKADFKDRTSTALILFTSDDNRYVFRSISIGSLGPLGSESVLTALRPSLHAATTYLIYGSCQSAKRPINP